MKNFFIINLDFKRIILVAGGLLFLLGSFLYLGMIIGQKKSSSEQTVALSDPYKDGLQSSPLESKPIDPARAETVPPKLDLPKSPLTAKVEHGLEIQSDPLIQGPPKSAYVKKPIKKISKASSSETDETATSRKNTGKKKDTVVVSGKIEHGKTDPKARYVIQVAAYKKESDAIRLISKLKENGLKARSEHTGNFYFVVVGKTRNKEKLEKALSKLKDLEYDAYIRKISAESKAS